MIKDNIFSIGKAKEFEEGTGEFFGGI